MKKILLNSLLLVMLCALVFTFASCSLLDQFLNPEDNEPTCPPHVDADENNICDVCDELIVPDEPSEDYVPDLSDIAFKDKTVVYDGASHSLVIDGELPEGVSVQYDGNGKINVGSYKVTARFFYKGTELSSYEASATLTISKASVDMSDVHLLSVTKTYDGKEVVPSLVGELPEGVEVSFTAKNSLGETVDKMIDAGVYTVYASFSIDTANYFPIDPISATVTINAPKLDGVEFADATFSYDGEAHTILIKGDLPDGVRVVYEGGDKIAVGVYTVTAKFFIGDIELVDDMMSATLTITKATADMSGVSATDASGEYSGSAHYPSLLGDLPKGVEVVYTYADAMGNPVDEIVNVGAYRVTASFIYDTDCYNVINPMVFTYTVIKADLDAGDLYPASLSKVYDGIAVKPALMGIIPDGVEILYAYTDFLGETVEEILNVGEYTVVASFIYDEDNYEALEPVTFTYTVTKATYDLGGITLGDVTKIYDGDPVSVAVGTLPEGLSYTIVIKNSLGETVEEMINAGSYTVTVGFSGDFNNYYSVNDMTVSVSIERAAVAGLTFTDGVFNYDGEEKSIFVTGAPSWMEVTYVGNGASRPGTHIVTASFSENPNYLPVAPMEAKIIISVNTNAPSEGIIFVEYKDGYAVAGIDGDASIVIIPDTYNGKAVISIKSFAFDGNDKITYVYVPSSVVNIGNKAFANCTSLTGVEFGDIKVIGQQAFMNTAIKEISLPESLESIGYGAFEATELEKITLPFVGGSRNSSNRFIGFIFGGSTYSANSVRVPSSLKTVVISNGCDVIPSRAFYGVTSITEVVIGRSVKEIGNGAFQGCLSLRSVYIPASVTSIPANAKWENGPFFGTAGDMMLVLESINSIAGWGQYFSAIAEGKSALIVYDKTYDDYVMNKDSFRVSDPTDATLSAIFVGGYILNGFNGSVTEYNLYADVNKPIPTVGAIASTLGATVLIEQASVSNGNVASITVTSMNGEVVAVYTIKFNLTGSFTTSAEVVNKNGAKGTVTFVVDDGYRPTAGFMKSMMEKYPELAVTYAIKSELFLATSSDEYTLVDGLIVADIDNDGMLEYVFDENGNYTYVKNEEAIDFWRDILSVGRSEIVAHSHTHAFWGVNDEGGAQYTAFANRIYATLVEGSAKKEVYASMQIIKELFGGPFSGLTYVNAGIPPKEGDVAVTEEVKVYLSGMTVRVLEDTNVTVSDGKIYLSDITWVDLQSTVGTLPANTDIVTTADVSSGVIPAGTPIKLPGDHVTVPTLDNNGLPNVVKGFKAYIEDIYQQAYDDGILIGARTAGQKIYTPKDFVDVSNRIIRRAYIISTSTNDPAMPDSWKKHIDSALAVDGGWASFCIHAMTEDINEEGQGGHKITWDQAEALFQYAVGKGDDLWIATQTEATAYYHEWSTASVTASHDAENGLITVSLTDNERDDYYNLALTVKVAVPGNWASATVNGEEIAVRADSDGSCYVYVDIVPETTVSIIGK